MGRRVAEGYTVLLIATSGTPMTIGAGISVRTARSRLLTSGAS